MGEAYQQYGTSMQTVLEKHTPDSPPPAPDFLQISPKSGIGHAPENRNFV